MATITFTPGTSPFGGINMGSVGAQTFIGMLQSIIASVSTSTLVVYGGGFGPELRVSGTFGSFDSDGDPTSGTVTGIRYTDQPFPGATQATMQISGISLSVPTVYGWAATNNVAALESALFGGADTFTGSTASEAIYAFAGNDTVSAGFGNDTILGGLGDDVLSGGEGSDQIDTLTSVQAAGADQISGGGGDDQIGLSGADVIDGGDGTDRVIIFTVPTAGFTIDTLGMDTSTGITILDGAVLRNVEGLEVFGGAGNDTLIVTRAGPFNSGFRAGGGTDTLIADFSAGQFGNGLFRSGESLVGNFAGYSLESIERYGVTYRSSTSGQTVDLGLLAASFYSFTDATGSAFNDTVRGDSSANILEGLAGDDLLFGGGGNDTVNGGEGNDILYGNQGGNDSLNGGAGSDIVSYILVSTGLRIELASGGFSLLPGAQDTFISIEGIEGGQGDDTLVGDGAGNVLRGSLGGDFLYGLTGDDRLEGGAGADFLEGGAGFDLLDGGDGFDYARHDYASSGVIANLQYSWVNAGDAAGDAYVSVEGLVGSAFADALAGDGEINALYGLGGDDSLYGLGGSDFLSGDAGDDQLFGGLGADIMDGGEGFDYARYDDAVSGLTAHLAIAALNTGEAAGDSYAGIEGIVGTSFNDLLAGDGFNNIIYGGDGYDQIYGAQGNDILHAGGGILNFLWGGSGADSLFGGASLLDFARYDYAEAGVVADLLFASANAGEAAGDSFTDIESLVGSEFGDTLAATDGASEIYGLGGADAIYGRDGTDLLFGGADDDQIEGGAGADLVDGGDGFDFARFEFAATGVTVHLLYPHVNTGDAAGDGYRDIEGVVGSAFGDFLAGDGAANTIYGGGGDDSIYGLGGGDTLHGGAGVDSFVFLSGDSAPSAPDTILEFQTGADRIDLTGLRFGDADTVAVTDLGGGVFEIAHDRGGDGSAETLIRLNGAVVLADILV